MMPPGGSTVYVSERGSSNEQKIQFQLKFALERALKAEKALVTLKYQQNKERMESDMKKSEEEYLTKMKIYNSIPEQFARIQEEFTNKVRMIESAISYSRQIHMLSLTGLDQGLTMDELPLSIPNQNPDDFRNLIFSKIRVKQQADQSISTTNVSISQQHTSLANGMSTTNVSHGVQSQRQAAVPPISQAHQYNPLSTQNSFQQQMSASQNLFQSQTQSRIAAARQQTSFNNYIMQQHTPQPALVMSSQTAAAQEVTSSSLTAAQGISQTITALAAQRESPVTTHSTPANGSTQSAEREFFDTLAAQDNARDNNKMADIKSSIREAETTLLTSNYFTKLADSESDIGLDDFHVDEDNFPAEKRQMISPAEGKKKSIASDDNPDDSDAVSDGDDDNDDEQFARRFLKTQGAKTVKTSKPATSSYAKIASVVSSEKPQSQPSKLAAFLKPAQRKADGAVISNVPSQKYNPYKTALCKEYMMTKRCKHGEYCLYAHGEKELKVVSKGKDEEAGNQFYKTHMCKVYAAGEECRYGIHCNFAHGNQELRNPKDSSHVPEGNGERILYYKTLLCNYYTQNRLCPHGTDCNYAHGKEELRKPVFTSHNNPYQKHPEPCDDQDCNGKLAFLLRKTTPCSFYPRGTCANGDSCRYAHGDHELKDMPKWEMCEKYMEGECLHMENPERCVYAHSPKELKKNPYANMPTLGTRNTAGQPYQTPATPSTPVDGDECAICMGPLLERKNLMKCGHNNFHERCISQWLNEREASCPICRKPAQLPDIFSPPAVFQPQDFPPC